MFTLIVTTGRIEKTEIMKCFDFTRVEFINNSNPEDEYKEKHYAFQGHLDDLAVAARKLDDMSDHRVNYALMLFGARPSLISTNGTHGVFVSRKKL